MWEVWGYVTDVKNMKYCSEMDSIFAIVYICEPHKYKIGSNYVVLFYLNDIPRWQEADSK